MSNVGSDEKSIRARRVRAIARRTALIVLVPVCFCVFISALFGVPQSFLGPWWMKPPR